MVDFIQTVRDDFDSLKNEATKFEDFAYSRDKNQQKPWKLFYNETPENEIRFSGKEHVKDIFCGMPFVNVKY